MKSVTLGDIKTLALGFCDLPAEGIKCPVSTTMLNYWSNQAWQAVYEEIVGSCPDWLTAYASFTLSTTKDRYDVLDCYKIIKVMLKTGLIHVNLEQWNYNTLDVLKTMQPATNYILKYRLINNQIWFHRMPYGTDDILYYYIPQPVELRSNTDVISMDIPWNWADAIIMRVASKCAAKLDLPIVDTCDKEYSFAMDSLKRKSKERDVGTACMITDQFRGLVL